MRTWCAGNCCSLSWTEFINILSYKAEDAGSKVILVDPVNTTKQCSNCNLIQNKTLAQRWHECMCGTSIHRDLNAARNILKRATSKSSFRATLGHRGSNAWGELNNSSLKEPRSPAL